MSEAKSRLRPFRGLPAVLGLLAVVAAVTAIWVTSAFAADGAAGDRSSSDDPAAAYAQNDGNDDGARDRNCPDRDGEPEQSSDV